MRYGCEVLGRIILHDLKESVCFDHSKDMSVHVSICASYDFNALVHFVWKLWH